MRNEALCGTGDFLHACFPDSFSQLVALLRFTFPNWRICFYYPTLRNDSGRYFTLSIHPSSLDLSASRVLNFVQNCRNKSSNKDCTLSTLTFAILLCQPFPNLSTRPPPIVVTTGIKPSSNIGSALVSAMYGRSSELGLYLWGNKALPTVQEHPLLVSGGCSCMVGRVQFP